jgi:hypothetical protein
MSEYRERLVHVLLLEELGSERSPDVVAAVMARIPVRATDRPRRKVWPMALAAAAVAVLIALAGYALVGRYPGPKADGDFTVVGGGAIQRGSVVETGAAGATVQLGGYCQLECDPHTQLTLEGGQRQEGIYLAEGAVTCRVDGKQGTFGVRSDVGQVHVTGTEFTVRIMDEKGAEGMLVKRMWVHVMVGAVLVSGAWGTQTVSAGEAAVVPASGTFAGLITEKGEGWLRVKAPTGESERFTARWVGGLPDAGGGLDKDMVRAIAERRVGDKVELKWVLEERKRVVELKLIEAAPAETPKPAEKPKETPKPAVTPTSSFEKGTTGTFTGLVTEKGDGWLRVKSADGKSERFTPKWVGTGTGVGGSFDKDIVKAIAERKVGDKVEIKWSMDERPRVLELKLLAAAPAETPKTEKK